MKQGFCYVLCARAVLRSCISAMTLVESMLMMCPPTTLTAPQGHRLQLLPVPLAPPRAQPST